jgi:[protein-PII] uridylyltransferase
MRSRELSPEIAGLLAERERLAGESTTADGWAVVRSLSDAVDRAVVGIWDRVAPPDEVALVALGGYGRRELSPCSDIDLMVLYPGGGSGARRVPVAAEALFYELWDSGMQVGHSVRTLKEAVGIAREDLGAETAFLDARLLGGDKELYDRFLEESLQQTRSSRPSFLERIAVATEERRSRSGDASGDLEPNLKEGRGGLRECQTIGWITKVTGRPAGHDAERVQEAVGRLHLVRSALHAVTGRHTDVLGVQWLPQVAEAVAPLLGSGKRGPEAEDDLMRLLYSGCRSISFALDALLDPQTEEILRALPPGLLDGRWSERGRRAFLDVLASGAVGVGVLRALDEHGVLVRLLPEWASIRCLPQRNVYHRWPVDLHSFEAVAALAVFAPGEAEADASPLRSGLFRRAQVRAASSGPPPGAGTAAAHRPDWRDLTRRVAADAAHDWDRLLVSALLHDIGKGSDGDHSVHGEDLARTAAERMGMPADDVEEITWLVRRHLTLTKTAVRRNIDDESLVVELAEAVGSVSRLRLLYLLSVADGLATSPAAWTPWKATLVADLFTRVFNVLERGELVSHQASLLAKARSSELRDALAQFQQDQVDRHLAGMPRAWLLSQSTRALVMQSKIMLRVASGRLPHLEASFFAEPDVWEVIVVALDRPGLFSKVSGVLALHGLNVLSAQIFTREDGVGLEVFRVSGTGERFDRVARDVDRALRGRISLDFRLEEKRRQYASRIAKGARQPPTVRVDNGASDFFTVIEVHAADHIGLLYDVTRALADLELDVHLAKIGTYGEDVVDAFYVRDLDGQKVNDPEHVREIERSILHKLG